MFNLTFDTTKGFNIWTDRTSHLLYCPKPVCELSFSRFLPSAVLCWCWGRSLICRYNHNTHNLAFCIFLCWTFNNFNKLWIVIVINNEKQIDHISKIMSKSHGIFTENFTVFFLYFFQMEEKLEACWKLNLINSTRKSFWNDINVTFTS